MVSVRDAVLEALHRGPVSGPALARERGVSRTAVWKAIELLRREGYSIEGKPRRGYVLERHDLLSPYEIRRGLGAAVVGREVLCLEEVGSTNDLAKIRAAEGAAEGLVVMAAVQREGRGRLGRTWRSPVGGVWLSVLLRPRLAPERAPILALSAGVAVARSLKGLYGLDTRLKWPNDVLIGGRKIAGILTEMGAELGRLDYVVVGVGVNADFGLEALPADLRKRATTLREEVGGRVSRLALVRRLLEELEGTYGKALDQGLLEEYKALSATLGKMVRVVTGEATLEGKAVDVDRDGALIIEKDGAL
ncbi:MAG: biotin--[acetyl-CoA-carboxylase] ligase, partial [Candidatus Hydrothermarchaeota archaeon]